MTRSICILLLLASTAFAQPKTPPSADAIKKAEAHFENGEKFRKFGNHDDAVREFLAGYELTGATEFLFNAAQAYREKGDKRMAVAYYKKYLELDANGDGALFARSHVELLEKEIREAEEQAAKLKRETEQADQKRKADIEVARKAAEATARREAEAMTRIKVSESDAARRNTTARWLRRTGIAAGATGLATLGVALYFGHRASKLSDEVSRVEGMWTEQLEQKVDDAESAETTMIVLLGAGSAAVITGGVLYYLGARGTTEHKVVLAPLRGGAGVLVQGRF